MFEVKCSDCGNETAVPFKPTPGKPVYCRTCFPKHAGHRAETRDKAKGEGCGPKQVWARRRDSGVAKRKEETSSVFQRR